MRLQLRFLILIGMLGATVAVNAGVAVWAVRFLERELSWPLGSIQQVMTGLYEIKRAVEEQAAVVGEERAPGDPAVDPGEARRQFQQAADRMQIQLEQMARTESYIVRSGVSTTRNLATRASASQGLAARWFEGGDPRDRVELVRQLENIHDLIERIEGRILDDAALAVDFGARLQTVVVWLIALTVAGVGLASLLAAILVRRWVLRPVGALRIAAERFAAGDLSHRIRVPSGGDELAMLSGEINEMAGTIERMQAERIERERLAAVGEMTRRIVHNLRKPLSGIRGLAETTRSELPASSDLVEVQDRIIRAVDRFEEWLRDVLRVSTPLELSLRRTSVEPWIRDVLDGHQPEAAGAGVTLDLVIDGQPRPVLLDPVHLEHAVGAVISNAIGFSPHGSRVLVRVGFADATRSGRWEIQIRDSGPGVAAHQAETIFQPYVTTRSGGTGIGLAVARRVARQHGGEITVEPSVDRPTTPGGACFVFRLPMEPVANIGRNGENIGQDSVDRGR